MDALQAFLGVFLCLLALFLFNGRRRGKMPPGPFQWPIIGNLVQVLQIDAVYPFVAFAKLAKKHGNVLGLRMGTVDTVVLNGYDTIKEALCSTDDFLNRFDEDWFMDRAFGKPIGLLESRVEFWRPTRRFTMRHLRDFGFGKKQAMQGFADEELEALVTHFERAIEKNEGVLSPNTIFQIPSFNLAWASAAGFRFDHDDAKIKGLLSLNSELIQEAQITGTAATVFPILLKLLPSRFNFDKLKDINHRIQAFLKTMVEDVKMQGMYKTDPQSFLDVFLKQIESREKEDDIDIFTEENLITIIYDLFIAAGDTTSATLAFGFLWLTLHPEVQEKCYEEISRRVISTGRMPLLGDKMDMPYVRATILEMHRRSHIVPMLPHKVYKDTQFQGCIIPGNTLVVINQYSAQMDRDFWGDPERFRPERFIGPNGDIINEHRLLTFSIGKRNCIGETVAETSIFSFLTGLIAKYKFLPVHSPEKYETKPFNGGVLSPYPFEVKVVRRF